LLSLFVSLDLLVQALRVLDLLVQALRVEKPRFWLLLTQIVSLADAINRPVAVHTRWV
jgi:hypothetical protein